MVPSTLETWATATSLVFGPMMAAKAVDIQTAVLAHGRDLEHTAGGVAQQLPRHDIGMVFHSREDNLVAGLQKGAAEAGGHQIDGFGGALGEDDSPRGFRH